MILRIFKPSFWKILYRQRFLFLILSLSLISFGLKTIFYDVHADYLQGELVKILFIHVPFAWMSILIYISMSIAAFSCLILKTPFAYRLMLRLNPLGILFTILTLLTGSIWGKPAWGTWWVWDARLTSVLILFFIYLGFHLLNKSLDRPEKAHKIMSLYTLLGAINIPIIKFSVDWWNTLHQPSTITKNLSNHLHESYWLPLFLMFFGFIFWSLFLVLNRINRHE